MFSLIGRANSSQTLENVVYPPEFLFHSGSYVAKWYLGSGFLRSNSTYPMNYL